MDRMSELVRYEIRDQVAVVTVDNPPVNALSPGVPEAIEAAVLRAAQDPQARAVVLMVTIEHRYQNRGIEERFHLALLFSRSRSSRTRHSV